MSRKKHRPEEVARTSSGLEEPYPSSPHRQPQHCLYMRYPHNAEDGEGRLLVLNFCGTYAAKKVLDEVIGDDKYKWLMSNKSSIVRGNPDTILTERGVSIREPGTLDQIIEHEYTREEAAWQIPPQNLRTIRSFLRPYPDETIPCENGIHVEEPSRRERGDKTPRPNREGLVSIKDIADGLRLSDRAARTMLRKAGVQKPDAGWAFAPADADKITAQLKSLM